MANNKKKNSNTVKRKSNQNKKVVEEEKFDFSYHNTIRLVLIIGAIFGLFYLLTWFITKEPKTEETNNDYYEDTFSHTQIVAGKTFSMEDGEYYVLFYDSTDEDLEEIYSTLPSSYRGKEGALSIYTVNMGDALNKRLSSENSNSHPNNASELAINGPTLIKISNHEVVDYIEGEESIKSVLE